MNFHGIVLCFHIIYLRMSSSSTSHIIKNTTNHNFLPNNANQKPSQQYKPKPSQTMQANLPKPTTTSFPTTQTTLQTMQTTLQTNCNLHSQQFKPQLHSQTMQTTFEKHCKLPSKQTTTSFPTMQGCRVTDSQTVIVSNPQS